MLIVWALIMELGSMESSLLSTGAWVTAEVGAENTSISSRRTIWVPPDPPFEEASLGAAWETARLAGAAVGSPADCAAAPREKKPAAETAAAN